MKKYIVSIMLVFCVSIIFFFVYKTDYDKTINTYSNEIKECFPKKIPKEAKKMKVKENSGFDYPYLYLQFYMEKKHYKQWCENWGKNHPAIAEYRVRDNKIRYADEAGEVIMKDNYVISTGFFQKLSIPKTSASWKFHIMMNKNEDKKEEWNHGTICGWAENEEIRCIIFYYEEW